MPKTTEAMGEAELIDAAKRGDAGALEALFARFEGPVYRFGLRMCRDPEDAREVLQETLLAATRALRDFRGDASLGTWLYTIARSFCIKQRRRRARRLAAGVEPAGDAAEEVPDPAARPDEVAGDREVGAALQRALDELPAGYRDVLVLRDVEGLTAPEAAAALGVSVDAIKSRLHRARVVMREKLAPLMGEAPLLPRAEGCPDVMDLFSRHLEGEIDAELCARMERHLAGCPRCASACDSLRRTLSTCRAAGGAPVPPAVQTAVLRAVRDLLRLRG